MSNLNVLVIDDERNLVRSLCFSLQDQHIDITGAYTGQEGIERAQSDNPDLVLLDLGLPDMSGLDVLPRLKAHCSELPVIMISAHGDTRAAVKAVKEGAVDYITKPFDQEELVVLIHRSTERARMARELSFLRQRHQHTHRLIGNTPPMQQLRQIVEQVGQSAGKTLLVTGPSGTGKALIARSIHDVRFQNAPFIEINCAALPEQLIEAELFGAERGAYTGANQRRTGLIDLADGGTLFLDEIGELPLTLQSKLLSFLENRSYRPIGGGRERKADVVVIAATNRQLKDEVDAGTFRADLYFRLNVLPIQAPALSDRTDDIPLLVNHFSDVLARQEGCHPTAWSEPAMNALVHYPWPGNVRELRNLVERMTILNPGRNVRIDQLPDDFLIASQRAITPDAAASDRTVPDTGYNQAVANKERQLILSALQETGGRKGLAAERLGISRHALKRRMQRLNMDH